MSEKQDIEIQCAEKGCTEVRIFTVRDQEFYAQKGYSMPKRCKFHAQQRRKAHQEREEENQQERRDQWHGEDRGRGSYIPGQESDAEMLGDHASQD